MFACRLCSNLGSKIVQTPKSLASMLKNIVSYPPLTHAFLKWPFLTDFKKYTHTPPYGMKFWCSGRKMEKTLKIHEFAPRWHILNVPERYACIRTHILHECVYYRLQIYTHVYYTRAQFLSLYMHTHIPSHNHSHNHVSCRLLVLPGISHRQVVPPCLIPWVPWLPKVAHSLKDWGYRPTKLWGQWHLQSISSISDGDQRWLIEPLAL